MVSPQGAVPVTPEFDAPEPGDEMQSADMGLPIGGRCPEDAKRALMPLAARGLPSPNEASAEERAIHNLAHIPYRSWCPYCVAGTRPNTPHRRIVVPRSIPLLSADYGFISDPGGELVTVLVVSVSPYGIIFAAVVDSKGAQPPVVKQLATWIQECGLVHFAYRRRRSDMRSA